MMDKETLEKMRLKMRRQGYKDEGLQLDSVIPLDSHSHGFISETERFYTDTAGEQKRERDRRLMSREQFFEKKRENLMHKEEERWERIEAEKKKEEERVLYLRDHTLKAKKNESSVPYDPVTLKYNDNADGIRLRHADEAIKYRAATRAYNLQAQQARSGYNPITGEPIEFTAIPSAPNPLPQNIRR